MAHTKCLIIYVSIIFYGKKQPYQREELGDLEGVKN